jgi:hypothetical protein
MMPRPRISPASTTRFVVVSVSQATRAFRVLGQEQVDDGVADPVGDLVRVAFGHALAGEGEG